jgi:lipopolysaccharide export system ATP-binding protein
LDESDTHYLARSCAPAELSVYCGRGADVIVPDMSPHRIDAHAAQQERRPRSASSFRALTLSAVEKAFDHHQVLRGVTMHVEPGEVVGLLGRDGAGKTLCFDLIMGLAMVDRGRILLGNTDVTEWTADQRAWLGLTYLPQETSIFRDMTVEENIEAVLEWCEPDAGTASVRLEEILAAFQLGHLRKIPAVHLSGGERRRCEIARAVAAHPSIMLLDEPLAGIDPLAVIEIRNAILALKAEGVGLLVSDQNLPEMLEMLDRVYVLHDGRVIFAGTTADMLKNEMVQRVYLGARLEPPDQERVAARSPPLPDGARPGFDAARLPEARRG